MKKWGIALLIILVGLSFYGYRSQKSDALKADNFEMIPVAIGDIKQIVTATGKIQPINTVSVGTQVSGIVEKVFADYNDEVTEGQLLAQLDTSVLIENKNDAKARLDLSIAKQKIAKLNYDRIEKLYQEKLIAKASLEEVLKAVDERNRFIASVSDPKGRTKRIPGWPEVRVLAGR